MSKILNHYEQNDMFLECQNLYIVADGEFISAIAGRLDFPRFMDQRAGCLQQLAEIKLLTPERNEGFHKIKTYPITTTITFFKNMIKTKLLQLLVRHLSLSTMTFLMRRY